MSIIHRLVAVAAISATASVSLIGSPASADKPVTVTPPPVSFTEPDPCDPNKTMTTTLNLSLSVHQHQNNYVVAGKVSAETTAGYSGTGRFTEVGGAKLNFTQRVIATNPDTEQRYIVKARARGESPTDLVVDSVELTCLRGFIGDG